MQKPTTDSDLKHEERLKLIININYALDKDYDPAFFDNNFSSPYYKKYFEELASDGEFAELLQKASEAFNPKEETDLQRLGIRGEKRVKEFINCELGGCFKCSPKNNKGTLRILPNSFLFSQNSPGRCSIDEGRHSGLNAFLASDMFLGPQSSAVISTSVPLGLWMKPMPEGQLR